MILIPVVLLTGFAILRIGQERANALDQARQEAARLAPRLLVLATSELEQTFTKALAKRASEQSPQCWVGEAELRSPDQWIRPIAYVAAPLPPAWLSALTPASRAVLYEAEQLELDPNLLPQAQEAWRRFLAIAPKEAQPFAQFRALCLLPAAEKTLRIQALIRDFPLDALTAAGFPLLPIVLMELLQTTSASSAEATAMMESVETAVLHCPGPAIPILLKRFEEWAKPGSPGQLIALSRWQDLWRRDEIVRRWLPLWSRASADFPDKNWHWIPDPESTNSVLTLIRPNDGTEKTVHLFLLDGGMFEGWLHDAADRLNGLLPAHARAILEVRDRSARPLSENLRGRTDSTSLALAEHSVRLSSLNLELPLRLELLLADPNALYQQENRRAVTLGIVVLVSGGIALCGLWVFGRTFRQQVALYEAQSNFISSVSHELRTPIAAMSLMAENLTRDESLGAPRKKDYYRMLVQECRRLSSLLENVLSLARLERQKELSTLEPINFTALVTVVVRSMQLLADAQKVNLCGPPNDTPELEVVGDPAALERALVNLIDNAIKHSPPSATVSVTVRGDEKGVEVSVQDQGPGIPIEEQKKVFERFYRRGSELRRETKGIGIGLTLVQQIAEAHQGSIELESKLGQGSCFTLRIPRSTRSSL